MVMVNKRLTRLLPLAIATLLAVPSLHATGASASASARPVTAAATVSVTIPAIFGVDVANGQSVKSAPPSRRTREAAVNMRVFGTIHGSSLKMRRYWQGERTRDSRYSPVRDDRSVERPAKLRPAGAGEAIGWKTLDDRVEMPSSSQNASFKPATTPTLIYEYWHF